MGEREGDHSRASSRSPPDSAAADAAFAPEPDAAFAPEPDADGAPEPDADGAGLAMGFEPVLDAPDVGFFGDAGFFLGAGAGASLPDGREVDASGEAALAAGRFPLAPVAAFAAAALP
ncbi:MAG TPA: hypothetical protein VFQ25_14210 [Ktedonobacterales bacterium]|nr:hypothetical protein [Ktedonobacterales bacterium]